MIPYLFLWAPQYHFPLSGAVKQQIDPDVYFDAIPPTSGNGEIEKDIFYHHASYGKQLGLLTDVVLALAENADINKTKLQPVLNELKSIKLAVAESKKENTSLMLKRLRQLKQTSPEQFQALLDQL